MVETTNILQKLIDGAKLNNYYLYKSYQFLKQSNNIDILLNFLMLSTKREPQLLEVITVIEKFVQNKQEWLSKSDLIRFHLSLVP